MRFYTLYNVLSSWSSILFCLIVKAYYFMLNLILIKKKIVLEFVFYSRPAYCAVTAEPHRVISALHFRRKFVVYFFKLNRFNSGTNTSTSYT